MELYFLRHAIATDRASVHFPNDDRPLTEEGVRKMKKGAKGIVKVADKPDIIVSSPLVRAYDTAQIAAKELNYIEEIKRHDKLLPTADFKDFLSLLEEHRSKKTLLFVGHEPNMSKVISTLLGSSRVVVDLKKGGLCKIKIDGALGSGKGMLIFHLTPKQLRLLAS